MEVPDSKRDYSRIKIFEGEGGPIEGWVDGDDEAGVGGRISTAIADAGINLRGVSAAVIGKKFVAYFGFDSAADATKATRALKALARPKKTGKG